ncbi:DUF3422 family protein [Paracoccus sp. S-4012]|uniref:DUF3422 family protein n=1 Tax=Paracoccus sp. S-4012 TaxID=2665648 RepID=UPI0012B0520F|nr:DUF3422 domain-containing protein [Paracoccus sp. S-4012]MRX51244.1 DUF3422 family protein [Paracoccus sp. S-4012]
MNDSLDHPLRYGMVNELHARPSARLQAPCTVVHLAFKEPRDAANRDRARDLAHLAALTARHGAPSPESGASHYAAAIGRHELRWESHTEFVSYTAIAPGLPPRAFDPAAAEVFPPAWQAEAPGCRIAAAIVQVDLLPDDPAGIEPLLERWFAIESLTAFQVLDEAAVVAGDFRIDPAGFMRFAVFVRPEAGQGRIGRIVQRVLELETYRAMAMLGLPRSRELSASLNAMDTRLSALMEGMGDAARPAEAVLDDLLDLSAELEGTAVRHSFRFGATGAYEAIVHDRIATLRESRFRGRQTLTEFMTRRFEPAMRTVRSARARLQAMLDRTERAGELLRTRVDVQRSAQNQALLASMDARADLQLRLQHTVEGLSVVAISYYAVGLAGYVLAPMAAAAGIDRVWLNAALVPVVVLLTWAALRRIRRRLHQP